MQRVALVEGGLDVALLVADVAAGEGAGGGLDLGFEFGGKGRCRHGEGADEGDEGGDKLGDVRCGSSSDRIGKGEAFTRTILP